MQEWGERKVEFRLDCEGRVSAPILPSGRLAGKLPQLGAPESADSRPTGKAYSLEGHCLTGAVGCAQAAGGLGNPPVWREGLSADPCGGFLGATVS